MKNNSKNIVIMLLVLLLTCSCKENEFNITPTKLTEAIISAYLDSCECYSGYTTERTIIFTCYREPSSIDFEIFEYDYYRCKNYLGQAIIKDSVRVMFFGDKCKVFLSVNGPAPKIKPKRDCWTEDCWADDIREWYVSIGKDTAFCSSSCDINDAYIIANFCAQRLPVHYVIIR